MKYFSVIIILFLGNLIFAQQPEIFKIQKYKVANLSDSLHENSGLDFFQNELVTFNDGGNTSELYLINSKSGKISKNFKTNLQNTDWEAITTDGENFYIGDFGNNAGTRQNLKIHKIKFDSATALHSKTIQYYYPEQKDFAPKNLNTDFDAEAMIFLNGKLHIFTKEWNSKSTTHYTIDPNISENQSAKKIETFKTDFVVTDASYYAGKLYLIGYTKKTEVFLQIFAVEDDVSFFLKPLKKYYLGSTISLSQIEGIAVNETGIYISGERFIFPLGKTPSKLFHIPLQDLK